MTTLYLAAVSHSFNCMTKYGFLEIICLIEMHWADDMLGKCKHCLLELVFAMIACEQDHKYMQHIWEVLQWKSFLASLPTLLMFLGF